MKKLRFTSKVYDTQTCEYVQRINELPISNETAESLLKDLTATDACPVIGYGYGDGRNETKTCESVSNTPLRNHKRFAICPVVQIVETDENGEDEKIMGGWSWL